MLKYELHGSNLASMAEIVRVADAVVDIDSDPIARGFEAVAVARW